MAKFPTVREGFDPTGSEDCIQRSELLQMVREIAFVDGIGPVLELPAAPDVVTYPKLRYFIWAKTVGGIKNGEFYYYDGTEWQPWGVPPGTLTGAAFADGSIDLSKLAVPAASAGYIVRVNVSNTAFEVVDLDGLFGVGSIALDKLASAGGGRYFLLSNSSGAYIATDFDSTFAAALLDSTLAVSALVDTDNAAQPLQVPYFPAAGSFAAFAFAKDLITDGTLLTAKLKLSALAGRYVKVNAAGTDFEAAADVGIKIAKITATAAANVNAQVINTAAATVVTLDSETSDPDNIITLAANKIKVAAAGTYEFDVDVPLFLASGNLVLQVELYNETGAAVLDYRNARIVEGGDLASATLTSRITATADQEFSVRIICATAPTNLYLGSPANIGGRNEIYTQVIIRKLS
jgi:hypothetical protein